MKFVKIGILSMAFPLVVQAAEAERSGLFCSCFCGKVEDAVPVVQAAPRQAAIIDYLESHPKARIVHLTTDSADMRARRQEMGASLQSPSAKKEVEGSRVMRTAAASIEVRDLHKEQLANTRFWEKKPKPVPTEALMLVSKTGAVEQQRHRKTKLALATQQEATHVRTASMSVVHSEPSPRQEAQGSLQAAAVPKALAVRTASMEPHLEGERLHRQPHVFTFDAATPVQQSAHKPHASTLPLHASVIVGLSDGQTPKLGQFMAPKQKSARLSLGQAPRSTEQTETTLLPGQVVAEAMPEPA